MFQKWSNFLIFVQTFHHLKKVDYSLPSSKPLALNLKKKRDSFLHLGQGEKKKKETEISIYIACVHLFKVLNTCHSTCDSI